MHGQPEPQARAVRAIARAFSTHLIIDTGWDPRLIGAAGSGDPITTISSGPAGTVNSTTASFAFTSTGAGATFECSLDSAPFSACTSPRTYSGLSEGGHTFAVRATDSSDTTGPAASATWTVDVTPPNVSATHPVAGASEVSTATTISATFSEPMAAGSITGTSFTLRRSGDGMAVPASVSYNDPTRTATLVPTSGLGTGTGYVASLAGGPSGVRDLANNPMSSPVSWSFTTSSGTPPSQPITRQSVSTVVNSAASSVITVPRPSGVSAGDVLVSCLVTNGREVASGGTPAGWISLASVTTVSNPHLFGYYHVAGASEPSSYSWMLSASVASSGGIARYSGVSLTQPVDGSVSTASGGAALAATVPGVTTASAGDMLVGCLGANTSSGNVSITAPSGMTTAWDLGGKRQQLADQPLSAAGATGDRTWALGKAREWGGWLVALRANGSAPQPPEAPETAITAGPSGTVSSTTASFSFSASIVGSTFACSLDGGAYAGCISPTTYSGLAEGDHTFAVRATAAGVTDPTPAMQGWTVAPEPPPSGAIARASVSTTVNGTASSTLTVPAPVGVTAGDVLVSCLALNGGSIPGSGVPAGWQPIAAVTAISNPHLFGYYHVAGGSEPSSYRWTLSSSVASSGGIARYTGVNAIQPLDAAASTASGAQATSATLPGITAGRAGVLLVGCLAVNSSKATLQISSPAGMRTAWDLDGKRQQLDDELLSIAGASGSRTWQLSSGREWAGWLVGLRPG